MTPKQRMQVQNDWRTGKIKVVVATIAFGMGALAMGGRSRADAVGQGVGFMRLRSNSSGLL